MKDFFSGLMVQLHLLVGTPLFQWLGKVAMTNAIAYSVAHQFVPNAQWVVGLVTFVLGAIFHSAPTDPTQRATLKASLKRAVMVLLALGFMVGSAHADWSVKSKSLAKWSLVSHVKPGNLGAVLPAGLDENDLILLPTAALGLGVGDIKNSYGFSAAYDLLWCHVKGVDGSHSTLTPYLGVGAAVYVDLGPWLNSELANPIQARLGINVIGPELVGIVPGIMQTWDLRNGERRIVVNANVPFGLFSDAALIRLFHL